MTADSSGNRKAALAPAPTPEYSADNDVHHQLMDAIKQASTVSLHVATARELTGPAPYVTPHEQLLHSIRRASRADLVPVQAASSDTGSIKGAGVAVAVAVAVACGCGCSCGCGCAGPPISLNMGLMLRNPV